MSETINKNVKVSDLRPGNLVQTEYGILPVHVISFNDVQVKAKDGRILWAKRFEGVEIDADSVELHDQFMALYNIAKPIFDKLAYIDFIHQAQNIYYWIANRELEIAI